jgi:hypothetical protein
MSYGPITGDSALATDADPAALVAVTTARRRWPTSADSV